MLKNEITFALTKAMKKKDKESINTIRLMLAVIKDKEISTRSNGSSNEIMDNELLSLLHSMIKQRKESIDLYKKGKREELVKKENNEIKIIERFLPKQLNDNEIESVCKKTIIDLSVNDINDMSKIINELKNKFPGRIDMAKASSYVKKILTENTK